MKLLNKICLFLLLAILTSSVTYADGLVDIEGHFAADATRYLYERELFLGDENNRANLDDNINRSQFIALLVRIFGDKTLTPERYAPQFNDVTTDDWFYNDAIIARTMGITIGDGEGNLMPYTEITTEQVAIMLSRLMKEDTAYDIAINGVEPEYIYYRELAFAANYGMLHGEIIVPQKPATRGEVVYALQKAHMIVNTPPLAGFSEVSFGEEQPREEEPAPTEQPSFSEEQPADQAPEYIPEVRDMAYLNMTWQQMYRPGIPFPDMPMPGVGIVSPTWFSITNGRLMDKEADLYSVDGTIDTKLQSYASQSYMQAAKAAGLKVWPMFKREDKMTLQEVSNFLNDPTARANTISILMQLADEYGFDGINIDFENMYESDKNAYTAFVSELSAAAKQKGLAVSVDVNRYEKTSPTWSLPYDRAALAQVTDDVMLMAYDEYPVGGKIAGPVSSIPWTRSSIELTLKEVPAEKLVLGIPFYTRLWQLDQNGGVVKATSVGIKTQNNLIAENNATVTFDEKTGLNLAQWSKDGYNYKMWLEDETSIRQRIDLVKEYGLKGVASWSNSFADEATWQLIDTLLNE